jgi:hypothetical protein
MGRQRPRCRALAGEVARAPFKPLNCPPHQEAARMWRNVNGYFRFCGIGYGHRRIAVGKLRFDAALTYRYSGSHRPLQSGGKVTILTRCG